MRLIRNNSDLIPVRYQFWLTIHTRIEDYFNKHVNDIRFT